MSAPGGHTDPTTQSPPRAGDPSPAPGMDVLTAVSEFEARVAAFKSLYTQSQSAQVELERRRVEMAERETELKMLVEQAVSRERELAGAEADLAARRARADEAVADAHALRDQLRAEAEEAAALLEKRHAETDARAVEIAAAETRLAEARAAMDARAAEIAERERRAAQSDEAARRIREAEQGLTQRIAELNQRQQRMKDEAAALAEARRQAAEQAAVLESDRLLLAEQQRDVEARFHAVAADRLALEALEQEASEESARLAALRSELESKAAILAERDRRLDDRENSERIQDSASNEASAELHRQRAAHAELVEIVREYEQLWLLELRESARLASSPAPSAAITQEHDELRRVLAELKERLRAEITTARTLREELESARAERDASIKQTERLLAQRGTSAGTAPAPGRGGAIESLERRRRRLKLLRELLRKQARRVHKAGETLKKRYEQVEQVLAQRAELAAARNRVIEAEKRASRSRAASRAAVIVLCAVGAVGLIGAFSWAIAREVAPATFEAVSIVKAEGRDRDLSDAELHEWQAFHEGLLADPRLCEAASERFKRQGNAALANAAGVSDLIKTRLTTESLGDGELRLRLTGVGADQTVRTLETFTAGFMAYANSGHGKRLDGGVTVAAQPAIAGEAPIDNVRATYALGMLALGVSIALGAAIILWKRLSGVKTAFEQDVQLAGVLDDSRWANPERQ